MGTETDGLNFNGLTVAVVVKLNNPLMGTETQRPLLCKQQDPLVLLN